MPEPEFDEHQDAALGSEFVELTDPATASLLAAFWSYEAALAANDVPVLQGWFAAAPDTLRTDGAASLIGYDEISALRRGRPAPPARQVERLHLRRAGSGAAFVVAETVRPDGGRGAQSQLWVRRPEGWRVSAAHVATASPAASARAAEPTDQSIWRRLGEAGAPLVPGAPHGPLTGVRVAVKDLFALAGERIGAGNPQWLADAAPESHTAPAARALLDAGAEITGIAQTDEFAFSLAGTNIHYGTPENAAAPGCITGGSTSGPAAAVAAGFADLGLGTDTAGSIRVPASYCGLYGLRPTHGAVSSVGLLPLAPSFDTPGLLARDPHLLRRAAHTLLPPGDPAPVTTLLVANDLLDLVDISMRLAFVAAVRAFAGRTGLRLEMVPALCDGQLEEWLTAFRTVQTAEAWQNHGGWIAAHPNSLAGPIAARFAAGRDVAAEQWARADDVLAGARKVLDAQLTPGAALVLPAASSSAPPRDLAEAAVESIRATTLRLTCLASLAGLPAVVAPTLRLGTRPAGLCLVGAAGSDDALLELVCAGAKR